MFVAKSVADALALVEERDFVFALLDVNVGDETSLPIAGALSKRKVPFAFGTGYGTSLKLPPDLSEAVIVAKPYHRAGLVASLDRLL